MSHPEVQSMPKASRRSTRTIFSRLHRQSSRVRVEIYGLCIKVGRGQGDGGIRTRVGGLGTWGRETRDLRTSSMGRGDVWDGDAGTSNTGTQGTQDVNDYCSESEVNAISLSS